jgi:restriction system protein
MPVPDYQTLMAPALDALSDGQARTTIEVRAIVAERLALSEDDRRETIKSGSPVLDNRVH